MALLLQEVKDSLSTFREHQAAAAAEAMRQWEAASGRALALEEQQLKALEVQVGPLGRFRVPREKFPPFASEASRCFLVGTGPVCCLLTAVFSHPGEHPRGSGSDGYRDFVYARRSRPRA